MNKGFGFANDYTDHFNCFLSESYFRHHNQQLHKPIRNKYVIVKDGETERVEECKEIVVHSFSMGDVEDPDLFAAEPLHKWEMSEQGQWVMRNAVDTPTWHRSADVTTFGYRYQVRAKLLGPALTEWLLRYGSR